MKQQVEVTLKLSLWLDASMDEDAIVTHVRSALPDAFGASLTEMQNPVDILSVKLEAEIFGNERAVESPRFEIEHPKKDAPDRVYVRVDDKFDVAIVRTADGLILDVYPDGWDAPLETFTVWDDDVPAAEREVA